MLDKVKVLLAILGLDVHNRGLITVAMELRDAGMEVIYTGLRATAEEIVRAAVQEDVEAIGLSSLSGAHEEHFMSVSEKLKSEGAGDILLFCGGIIPKEDVTNLEQAGFQGVFPPGTTLEAIVGFLKTRLRP